MSEVGKKIQYLAKFKRALREVWCTDHQIINKLKCSVGGWMQHTMAARTHQMLYSILLFSQVLTQTGPQYSRGKDGTLFEFMGLNYYQSHHYEPNRNDILVSDFECNK